MIKEEDRLAITVKIIENECHIVPRGYFYKLSEGSIVKAPYFKGKLYTYICIYFVPILLFIQKLINFNRFGLFGNWKRTKFLSYKSTISPT